MAQKYCIKMAYQDSTNQPSNKYDLYIDLDGTLIKSDTLYESLLLLIKFKPWLIIVLPFWIFLGKASFKHKLAVKIPLIDVAILPL